jgi:hypothetical protein
MRMRQRREAELREVVAAEPGLTTIDLVHRTGIPYGYLRPIPQGHAAAR